MRKIAGAGHIGNQFVPEDELISRPPTELTHDWLNDVQNELVAAVQKDGAALGVSDHQLADVLGARIRHFATGSGLPNANIGPIWHDDYNSIMTWQAFTANGAAYTGYASVLVGSVLADTQPTPRLGYVKSGTNNLNRTAWAALRNWAIHNGIMVALGAWAAGEIAVKDNGDGTTFTVFDVRGEFPRFWDDGRNIDAGRVFGSWQNGTSIAVDLVADTTLAGGVSGGSIAQIGVDNYPEYSGGLSGNAIGGASSNSLGNSYTARPRNTTFLATIKF